MEIPAHIAVNTDDSFFSRLEKHPSIGSRISPNTALFPYKSAHSSAENLSITSSSPDHGLGYQTDDTTPASSDMNTDDMSSDEVEEFRDREVRAVAVGQG
jgi:hypothetical protein